MREIDGEEKFSTDNRSGLWCSLRSAVSQDSFTSVSCALLSLSLSLVEVNIYNLFKVLNILVLMYPPQINGVHALILGVKLVGNRITFWRTTANKVILGTISLNAWNEIENIQNMF